MKCRAIMVVALLLAGLFAAVGASAGMEKKKAEAGGQSAQELKKKVKGHFLLLAFLPYHL